MGIDMVVWFFLLFINHAKLYYWLKPYQTLHGFKTASLIVYTLHTVKICLVFPIISRELYILFNIWSLNAETSINYNKVWILFSLYPLMRRSDFFICYIIDFCLFLLFGLQQRRIDCDVFSTVILHNILH